MQSVSAPGCFRYLECKMFLAIDIAGQILFGFTSYSGDPFIAADWRNSMESEEAQERFVAVLSAGAPEYARLMETDDEEAFKRFKACMEVMVARVAAHRGQVAPTTGESLLAKFGNVGDAVAAAAAIQESLAALNGTAPVERRLMFGIGIDYGNALIREDNIFGITVSIANGLQSSASGGEIIISGSAYQQLPGREAKKFVHLGAVPVRGAKEAIEVFAYLEAAAATTPISQSKPRDAREWRRVVRHQSKPGIKNNEIVSGFDNEKDDTLEIRLEKIQDVASCLVLYLTGYIDTYNSWKFQKRVAKAIEAGYIRLIFDIADTETVSSAEIGCYTAFLKAIKPRGGDLVLLRMKPKVYEVYQLLGFSQFFNIRGNLDEAVAFFATSDQGGKVASFPRIIKCPVCSRELKASRAGRFRCSECRTILAIDNRGWVFLG